MQAKCQTAYAERRHTRNLILLQQHVLGVRRENIEFREANGRPMTLSNELLSHEALSRNVAAAQGAGTIRSGKKYGNPMKKNGLSSSGRPPTAPSICSRRVLHIQIACYLSG